jgi:hypothetical protein
MKRGIGYLSVAATLGLAAGAPAAQEPTAIRMLTAGVVTHVDHATRIIVLDNGHRVRASIIMIDGVHADIASVQPGRHVMVSGVEVPEPRPAARPGGAAQPR